jgi:hypothetical protein
MDYVKVTLQDGMEMIGWARGARGVKNDGFLVLGTGTKPDSTDGFGNINIPVEAIASIDRVQLAPVITKSHTLEDYLIQLPAL